MSNDEKQLPTKMSESALSTLILKGDISKFTDAEKVQYYHAICERLGIDPLTKPFDYLILEGKQTLYLNKSGAEQLNRVHKVSIGIKEQKRLEDIYVVTARAEQDDRYCESTGAVNLKGLYGDGLCNAMMKAETKAKRRATISLLGLAMLDETEIETIPNAQKIEVDVETGEVVNHQSLPEPLDWDGIIQTGVANKWPEGYIKQCLHEWKTQGLQPIDVYEEAKNKFSKMNEKSLVK